MDLHEQGRRCESVCSSTTGDTRTPQESERVDTDDASSTYAATPPLEGSQVHAQPMHDWQPADEKVLGFFALWWWDLNSERCLFSASQVSSSSSRCRSWPLRDSPVSGPVLTFHRLFLVPLRKKKKTDISRAHVHSPARRSVVIKVPPDIEGSRHCSERLCEFLQTELALQAQGRQLQPFHGARPRSSHGWSSRAGTLTTGPPTWARQRILVTRAPLDHFNQGA